MSASATLFSSLPEVGPCTASAATLLGNVLDLDVEADGVLAKPAQIRIGCRPAIAVLLQPGDGAVVDDLAVFIAPAAVDHLVDRDFVDVARDHAIHEAGCIAAR